MILGKNFFLGLAILCCYIVGTLESRPLNILFVVDYFPSSSQIYILNIITGLIDKGHNVSIFSFRNNKKYVSLHASIEKYKLLNRVIYEKFPKKLPECDIVFCQFGGLGKTILEMPNLSEWLQKRKVVVCFRGSDVMEYVKNPSSLNKYIFEKVDLFLPVCDFFKKRLIALGCHSEKIVVHHSAVDCAQFSFKIREKLEKHPIRFVSVCRLVKKKGIDYTIKAFAETVKKHPQIQFSIIGEGKERTNLQLLIKKLKLKKKVKLHGWKNHDEVVSILDKSHIFLLPSITLPSGSTEGIANALKEAMAMGLVSIATWHAGTPELIDNGVSGFLVPEKSAPRLVNAIEYVIEHPEIWKSIGLAARKKVEDEFETKQCIEELEELFYTLLGLIKTEEIV